MKSILLTVIVLSFGIFVCAQPKKTSGKTLRHLVMFKFKIDAKPEDIAKVVDSFRGLQKQIKEIKAFEWGTNNSPEKLNEGFTHCFCVSFSSEKDRDTYLPHPAHQAFVKMLTPFVEKAFVIDYLAEK